MIGINPLSVVPVPKSQWAMIEVAKKHFVQQFVEQKVVFDPVKSVLVLFRPFVPKPSLERVFKVRNVKYRMDPQELETLLDKCEITSQVPLTKDWVSTYTGHVIWKATAPNTTWETPMRVCTDQHTVLQIKPPPSCAIYQADDHHMTTCEWPDFFPSVTFQTRSRS
jgi:hypothetical protein